jgi:hypothetical protein
VEGCEEQVWLVTPEFHCLPNHLQKYSHSSLSVNSPEKVKSASINSIHAVHRNQYHTASKMTLTHPENFARRDVGHQYSLKIYNMVC